MSSPTTERLPPPPAANVKADLVLVGITALWGGSFVVVKDALEFADPFTFVTLRFTVGALATALVAWRHLWPRRETLRLYRSGALLGGFLYLGYVLQTAGLVYTTESRSAFITGLAVVLVPMVSIVLFRRLPALPSLAGVVIALVGLYVLTGGIDLAGERTMIWGDLLTLACALTFSIHIALTERFSPGQHPVALVSVQLWTVALLSAASMLFVPTRLTWSWGFLGAVLYAGLIANAFNIAAQTWAQARTTAVRAALIFSLEPVFAASLSVALGRERLGTRELVGGLLTVLAVLVAEVGNAWWAKRWKPT